MSGPNIIKPGFGPTGATPGRVVPCAQGDLPGVVTRMREEQRHVVVETRQRQITNNPLAEKWRKDNPQLDQFYTQVNEDQVNLNRARKNRNE